MMLQLVGMSLLRALASGMRFALDKMGRAAQIMAMASAHHRFNYIHPFLDGNGRVSRLMSHAMAAVAGIGAPSFERRNPTGAACLRYAQREGLFALSGACTGGSVSALVSADLMSRRAPEGFEAGRARKHGCAATGQTQRDRAALFCCGASLPALAGPWRSAISAG